MVAISDNSGRVLYSIDWNEGIIDISKYGVEYFIGNPRKLLSEQPKGVALRNEARKMWEYLKYKNLL